MHLQFRLADVLMFITVEFFLLHTFSSSFIGLHRSESKTLAQHNFSIMGFYTSERYFIYDHYYVPKYFTAEHNGASVTQLMESLV